MRFTEAPVAEKFDPDGEGYDYSSAIDSGGKPDEKTQHWGSLDPRTGLVLKGRSHPTWNEMVTSETDIGNTIVKSDDGRYYSVKMPRFAKAPPADKANGFADTPDNVVQNANNDFQFITGLNASFSEAKNGEVLFVSNDIFLFPKAIAEMSMSGYDIVSPAQYTESGHKLSNYSFSTACFMLHKLTFEIVGDFDEKLAPAYYEDIDYMIRAKRLGFTIGKDVGKCIHWASHTLSSQYTKKRISKM